MPDFITVTLLVCDYEQVFAVRSNVRLQIRHIAAYFPSDNSQAATEIFLSGGERNWYVAETADQIDRLIQYARDEQP